MDTSRRDGLGCDLTLSIIDFSSLATSTERMRIRGSPLGKKKRTHFHPYHLPLPNHLWHPAGRNVQSLYSSLLSVGRTREEGDTQKNVNLSPGSAPETNAFSSRICCISIRMAEGLKRI